MTQALWIAKTGLDAQSKRMSVISNNLANVNTTGFKRDRAVFEDLLYQNYRQIGAQSTQDTQIAAGLNIGTGVRTVATEKLFSQGSIVQTDNPFNLAIEGRGFFQIVMPDGTLSYTRDGSFKLDAQGQVVTSNGYQLQPAINIPANVTSVTIGEDGTVSVLNQGSSQPVQVGSIQLADFINPNGLQPIGKNLFAETAVSGPAQPGTPGVTGYGTLLQGNLEGSNVNVVEELVNMIEAQRSYEMNSKSIAATDHMLQYINNNI